MTITYPLTFPSDVSFSQIDVQLRNSSSKSTSPFSLEEQVYDFGGEVWEISGVLPPMKRELAEIYNSFLLSLRGQVGTFLMPIAGAYTPRGSWGGTPVVNGGSQTGDELDITGLPTSQTGVAKAGDFISLGTGTATRLYKIVADADSDGSGDMTVTIVPRLRTSPANGAAVSVTSANGVFRLTEQTALYSANADGFYNITFSCREAL
jgi:hypothetical protein